ncbi:MAG: helix-turn-helix transcriptional regulator [Anaerolineae bacterium]|nr:helix-turn-helix transcriptional regulator [Anaerolineae bacterium]
MLAKFGQKLTHEKIAEITGIRRPTITKWMGKRLFRQLDMGTVEPMAKWLDCHPEDLYEVVEVEDETPEKYAAPDPENWFAAELG